MVEKRDQDALTDHIEPVAIGLSTSCERCDTRLTMPIEILYYDAPSPTGVNDDAIFLAGPTSRGNARTQWRLDTIEMFKRMTPEDVTIKLVVPEFEDGKFEARVEERFGYRVGRAPWGVPRVSESKCGVLDWESAWLLSGARVCLFWLGTSATMPGLTTRAELGMVLGMRPSGLVIGAPPEAHGTDWARFQCAIRGIQFHERLDDVVHIAIHNLVEEVSEDDGCDDDEFEGDSEVDGDDDE